MMYDGMDTSVRNALFLHGFWRLKFGTFCFALEYLIDLISVRMNGMIDVLVTKEQYQYARLKVDAQPK